ncbi:hypothetical protein KFL_005740080 [Klebsormidium nitens]|uniref:DUF4336 domain-containing protein n=1 Tax=Klebsormidium nitens TaxID=105231 RepID=A0A1Y1IMR9_KLENI|nr:hypothetical protein KFL_005740080 [Klebsormidium nitens]|eukprot:GAQ89897.1 hypothetical protein KFL_005740080 [Klebsormidium nitens]
MLAAAASNAAANLGLSRASGDASRNCEADNRLAWKSYVGFRHAGCLTRVAESPQRRFRSGQIEREQCLKSRRQCGKIVCTTANVARGRFYLNVTGFPFPLNPLAFRRTVRTEVDPGSIWFFEQEQGLAGTNVTTNVRMTVIKLKSGGLWVHAPIAPTEECVRLIKELGEPVKYIVLTTYAYEHKVFVSPFARKFPKAQVWVAPGLWSYPIPLPVEAFGIFKAGTIKDDATETPWQDEIEHKVLESSPVGSVPGIGPYVELAFFHKASKSLLVTDAVIRVPDTPPEVIRKEALLDSARNGVVVSLRSGGKPIPDFKLFPGSNRIDDTEENRLLGWQRMLLLGLYFGPSDLLDPQESFRAIAGRLLVSPVVRTLVFTKIPDEALDWADRIVKDWRFQRVITCHLDSPIATSPREFRACFAFLEELVPGRRKKGLLDFFKAKTQNTGFVEEDFATLKGLDAFLVNLGVVPKPGPRN